MVSGASGNSSAISVSDPGNNLGHCWWTDPPILRLIARSRKSPTRSGRLKILVETVVVLFHFSLASVKDSKLYGGLRLGLLERDPTRMPHRVSMTTPPVCYLKSNCYGIWYQLVSSSLVRRGP